MSWRYVDPLLEKLSKHSTIIGKYWVCIVVIFRLTMLAFADRVWSDEQKEFKCNTKEIGCDNVCFNRFAPLSNVRLWGLQLLSICIPVSLYLVYIWHLVSRAQHDQEDQKNKNRAMKAVAAQQLNKLRLHAQQQKAKGGGAAAGAGMAPGGYGNIGGSLAPQNNPVTNQFASAQGTGCFKRFFNVNNNNNNNEQEYPSQNYVKAWISTIPENQRATDAANMTQPMSGQYPTRPNQYPNHNPQLKQRNINSNNAQVLGETPGQPAPIDGVLPFINMQELNKKLKKKAQYERFSQTILPNDWKQEAKKRPRNERNIWRFYIIQLLLRTILDVFFTWLQFKIYPFRFIVPEVYICGGEMPETRADPCPHKVDCFVSRPMEKTVFFLYFYIVAAICLIINIVELWYIGFYRLRHAFSPIKEISNNEPDTLPFEEILNLAAMQQNSIAQNQRQQQLPPSQQHPLPPPFPGQQDGVNSNLLEMGAKNLPQAQYTPVNNIKNNSQIQHSHHTNSSPHRSNNNNHQASHHSSQKQQQMNNPETPNANANNNLLVF